MKICIVKLSAMGDIIHSMVALQFIKKRYPKATIDWIVEDGFKGILENNPHIDNILPINLKSIKKKKTALFSQIKLLQQYSKNNYDIVIDAQGLIKSAIVSKIVGEKVVGSKIIGFDKESIREKFATWFYTHTVTIGYDKNVINRSIKVLCSSLDIEVTKEMILKKKPFLFAKSKSEFQDYIVFVVGASRENKVYPKEKFLQLALKLEKQIVVVWGNQEEHDIALYLASNASNVTVAPKGNLDNLKSIIASSSLVIGGDTGPTHIAWGCNVASIAIFGNTPHYRNTYITSINKVVKSKSEVDPLRLDYSDFSIRDIEVEEILSVYYIIFS